MIKRLLFACLLSSAPFGLLFNHASAKDVLAPGEVLWSERLPGNTTAHVFAERLWTKFQAGNAAAALSALQQEQDPVVQQMAAHALLSTLGQQPPREDSAALIAWAKAQPVRLWVQHEETAAAWFLPVLDLAGSARALEQNWLMQSQRDAWADELRADSRVALGRIAAAEAATQQRAAEALTLLTPGQRESISQLALQRPDGLRGEWWQGLSEVAPSAEVLRRLWQSDNPQHRLDAIRLASQQLAWTEAKTLLTDFEQDPELASASTLALIALSVSARGPAPAERDSLIATRLSKDASRDSAAAALARLQPEQRVELVDRLWSRPLGDSARGALQQALRLGGDARSLQLLERLDAEEAPR